MHADICDPDNDIAVERFKTTLTQLGAMCVGKSWDIGVDVLDLQIGKDVLTVFSDAWSIDIEGPEHLVQEVVRHFKQQGS